MKNRFELGVYEHQESAEFTGARAVTSRERRLLRFLPDVEVTTTTNDVRELTEDGHSFPEEAEVLRTFSYARKLTLAVHHLTDGHPTIVLHLENHDTVVSNEVTIAFDETLDGPPVADIRRTKVCNRAGERSNVDSGYANHHPAGYLQNERWRKERFAVTLTFKDRAQLNECTLVGETTETRTRIVRGSRADGTTSFATGFAFGLMV